MIRRIFPGWAYQLSINFCDLGKFPVVNSMAAIITNDRPFS